jgi:GxxExxY protein
MNAGTTTTNAMATTTTGIQLLHAALTEQVIGAFYQVYNAHGYGFLEKVYRRSMDVALSWRNLTVQAEVPFSVTFLGEIVGEYRADLVVDNRVIVECKSVEHIPAAYEAQVMNYLRASGISVGLLLNFGPKPVFKRFARSYPQK